MSVRCLSCRATGLREILSLGAQPLANGLLAAEQLAAPEMRYPLDLAFCPGCALVQITEVVAPERLFREYVYFSSYSETMLAHARDLVAEVFDRERVRADSLVVEVASNDGYLLQYYKARGVRVLGIEPALNIARVAEQDRGIPTIADFFGRELARRLAAEGTAADVIHAHNVLAHVPDPNGFAAGLRMLLAPRGTAVIEVPYVRDMIDGNEFDTIYHEHLGYFSLAALETLFERHGLAVKDVVRVAIHGGSLRLRIDHAGEVSTSPSLDALRAEELAAGVTTYGFYEGFARRVETLKASLLDVLLGLKKEGRRIGAYGAAAKGATLLNSTGIDSRLLDFVVDRSPHKQGHFMPGSRLPIVGPERLLEDPPDVVLILPWNIADEIVGQQAEYRRRGGRFLVAIPEVRFV
jgi:SAM-dependent methyltransferase